jgi:hypothetical protein
VNETRVDELQGEFEPYLDPYQPLVGSRATPATGSDSSADTELDLTDQPVATGTLFLMIIFLMMTFAIWGILYSTLLGR